MNSIPEIQVSSSKPPPTLQTVPEKDLVFHIVPDESNDSLVTLRLTSITDQWTIFRIRSTHRSRYLAKPSLGFVSPLGHGDVTIVVSSNHLPVDEEDASSTKDRFLLQTVCLDHALESDELSPFWDQIAKQHNPKRNIYACHESFFKCKFVFDENPSKSRKNSSETLPKEVNTKVLEELEIEQDCVSVGRDELAQLQRKEKEYEKVIKRSVELTLQKEKFEQLVGELRMQNEVLTRDLDRMKKRPFAQNPRKDSMQANIRHLDSLEEAFDDLKEEGQNTANMGEMIRKRAAGTPLGALGTTERDLNVAHLHSSSSKSKGMSVVGLVSVALVAFVLGRLL